MSNLAEPVCHNLFPLLIYENKVSCHEEVKAKFLKNYEEEKFPTELVEKMVLPDGSIASVKTTFQTGEFFNKTKLHLNREYSCFFHELNLHCKKYVELLGLNSEKLNFYVTKSWLVIHEFSDQNMNRHVHPESNISFAYYVSCPEGSQNFLVQNLSRQNELSPECFFMGIDSQSSKFQILKSSNVYNEESRKISSNEGSLILFPGWKTMHGTAISSNSSRKNCLRIAISGDIKITLKPDYSGAVTFSSPKEEWLLLDSVGNSS